MEIQTRSALNSRRQACQSLDQDVTDRVFSSKESNQIKIRNIITKRINNNYTDYTPPANDIYIKNEAFEKTPSIQHLKNKSLIQTPTVEYLRNKARFNATRDESSFINKTI